MVARRAHNPEVRGSSPLSATKKGQITWFVLFLFTQIPKTVQRKIRAQRKIPVVLYFLHFGNIFAKTLKAIQILRYDTEILSIKHSGSG